MNIQCMTMWSGNCFCAVLLFLLILESFDVTSAKRSGTCRVGELRCQNGDLCVPREQVCDGTRQCEDGLDEYVCKFRQGLYRNGPKKGAVFQCQFGGVIPLSRLCDGAVNCLDGSDESEICENNSCLPGQFRCAYGACIPDWMMCNGRRNCPDGSDETGEVCQDIQCKPTEFRCRYGGCIRKSQICDVKKHCSDGSDESEFLCLITRAKMLSEWEKEEEAKASKLDQKLEEKTYPKSPNSVLPSSNRPSGGGGRFPPTVKFVSEPKPEIVQTLSSTVGTTPSSITTASTEKPKNVSSSGSGTQPKRKGDGDDDDDASMDNESFKGEKNVESSVASSSSTTTTTTTTPIPKSETEPSSSSSLWKGEASGVSSTASPSFNAQRTVTCSLPEIPENTDAVISRCLFEGRPCDEKATTASLGTQIQYECDAGYSLYGPSVISCQEDGRWSLTPPTCEIMLDVRFGLGSVIPKDFKPRCSSLIPARGTLVECINPSNLAVKSCSELQKPGVEARFSCKPYYRPAGDLPVHYEKCGDDGNWSPGMSQQFSCVPDCGLSEVPKTPFIVNGKSIKRGQWPWHVGIYVDVDGKLTYICGGALITENAILTSGHCVTRHGSIVDPSKFKVFLGKQTITLPDSDPFVQSRLVSNIFVDESFNHRSLDSDIAIMALSTPAVLSYFVRPVCFPQTSNSFLEEYQLTQGNLGTVLGWGATENDTFSKELRMTELPVISHQDCVNAFRDFFASMTRSTNYCAGYTNGTSLCNGDSGGGQYFKAIVKGATRWYIQGLVSYGVPKEGGSKKCSSSHYTVFTRVGRYADWIVRTLSRENLI